MPIKRGLGRGLGALIRDAGIAEQAAEAGTGVVRIPVEKIRRNPLQPRRSPDEQGLAELARSIKERGILQPLLVRSAGDSYELIAGERRLVAAGQAGITEVPAIVMDTTDVAQLEIALIENLQREDLNALEEAEGYKMLAEKFGLTQELIAERVGKARASIANTMRLLSLPPEVKQMISEGALSAGHAKALTGLDIPGEQVLYARKAVKDHLSVRNLEKLIEKARRPPRKPRASRDDLPAAHLSYLSDKLHGHFGTAVRIMPSRTLANGKKAKGSIEIDFYSNDDLNRILEILGIPEEQ